MAVSSGVPGGCPGTGRGGLFPAPMLFPVPAAQLCFCSSLQPEVGLRKGPAAARRSRSRSVPPDAGQGLPHRPAAAATVPRLRWRVPSMEEMVIWEQHTVTLSKVRVARAARGRGRVCGPALPDPHLPVPVGPSTGLWLRCLWGPGPSQQGDWGHSGGRFGCGGRGTSNGAAPVSARGRGDMGDAHWEGQ